MTKPKKAAAPRKKASRPKETRLLAAFHETNFALCLAAGFVGPRTEPSAAQDHHFSRGGIVCSTLPMAAEYVAAARGGLDYGAVVLAEIRMEPGIGQRSLEDGSFQLPPRIPLAFVEKVYFQNEVEKSNFMARAGSYGDVPVEVVEYAVDPSLFPDCSLQLFDGLKLEVRQQVGDPVEPIDKLAGCIACLLRATHCTSSLRLDELLVATTTAGQKGVVGVSEAVANLLDPGDTTLAVAAALILGKGHPRNGFDPMEFLGQLAATPGNGSVVRRFSKHASDIVSARREIADDAFSDADGKISARALLLFMLNPDAERMGAVQARVPNVGERVHALALLFTGCFLGLAAMPASWKAPSKDAFLAVGLITFQLMNSSHPKLDFQVEWRPDGFGRISIRHGARVLAEQTVPPPPALKLVYDIAMRLQLKPKFAAGALSLGAPGLADTHVKTGRSFTFPREPVVEVTITLEASGRRPSSLIAQSLDDFQVHAVLVRATTSKPKRLEGLVQVRVDALTDEVLTQALEALRRCADVA